MKKTRVLPQKANVILYHVTTFSDYLSFSFDFYRVHTKTISSMLVSSVRITLDIFYLIIFQFEKLST